MKKFRMLFAIVATTYGLWADEEVINGVKWYYRYESSWQVAVGYGMNASCVYVSGAVITDCDGPFEGDLVIPESLGGYPVKAFWTSAFQNRRSLRSVTFPSSLVSIYNGSGLFQGCSGLREIRLNDGLLGIGSGSFNGCTNLRSLTVPPSVTYIGPSAFANCQRLKTVTIQSAQTVICENAFSSCPNLSELNLPKGEMTIYDSAFTSCSVLAVDSKQGSEEDFVIVNGILQAYIGEAKDVDIPLGVTNIGGGAFKGRIDIVSINIPEGVTEIGTGAFSGCSCLREVAFPLSLSNICDCAFEECSSLCTIEFPQGLKTINDFVFRGCTGIERISVADGNPYYYVENNCLISSQDQYHYYSDGSRSSVTVKGDLVAVAVKNDVVNVPNGVLNIGSSPFYNCAHLKELNLPEGLVKIDAWAFYGCRALSSLVIPSSVTSIHGQAFEGCSSLTNLQVCSGNSSYWCKNNCLVNNGGAMVTAATGNGVLDVPDGVVTVFGLKDCVELRAVRIPSGVQRLDHWAFKGCHNLSQVDLPDTLIEIGQQAFANCTSLREIQIPDGVRTLQSDSFRGCTNLRSIHIPSSVDYLTATTFSGCSSLESIVVDESNATYRSENNVLIRRSSNSLISCVIPADGKLLLPDGVECIERNALAGQSSLMAITIPDSVGTICDRALSNCISLECVDFVDGGKCVNVGRNAFAGCANLSSVSLPRNNVLPINYSSYMQEAFLGCPLNDIRLANGCDLAYGEDGTLRNRADEIVYTPVCNVKILRMSPRGIDPSVLDVTYEVRSSYTNVDVRVLGFIGGRGWRYAVRPQTFVLNPNGDASVIGKSVPANREVSFSWDIGKDLGAFASGDIQLEIYVNPVGLRKFDDSRLSMANDGIPFVSLTDERITDALEWLYAYGRDDLVITNGVLTGRNEVLANGTKLVVDAAADYLEDVFGPTFLPYCIPGIVSTTGTASVSLSKCGMIIDGQYTNIFASSYSKEQVVPYVADVTGDGFWDLVVVSGGETNVYARQPMSEYVNFSFLNSADVSVPQRVWLSNLVDVVTAGSVLDPLPRDAISASQGSDGDLFVSNSDGSIWLYRNSSLAEKAWGGADVGFASGLMIAAVDWDSDGDMDCVYGTADGRLGLLLDPHPAQVDGLRVDVGVDSVVLSWEPNLQLGNFGYRVYRDGEVITNSVVPVFREENLAAGKYSYAVTSLNRFYTPGTTVPRITEAPLSDAVVVEVGCPVFHWKRATVNNKGQVNVVYSIDNSYHYCAAGLAITNFYDVLSWRFLKVESSGLSEGLTWKLGGDGEVEGSMSPTGEVSLYVTGGELAAGSGTIFTFVFEDLTDISPTYQLGDVNGDGKVDVLDLRLLAKLKSAAGRKYNSDQLRAGDFNGNGKLDNADYQALRELLKERGLL